MSDYGEVFSGMEWIGRLLLVIFVIFFPLGVWKAVDIVVWLIGHISVNAK